MGDSSAPAIHGGTLTVLTSSTDVNFDPAKSQSMAVTSLAHVHRRLTSWHIAPGEQARVVPDLATGTGTVSKDGLSWTYRLKKGLFLENGAPITSTMVKHGVERSFASSLSGGLGYHKALLAGASGYAGPYTGRHLASIETPDESTIVFHLTRPYGDWPWIVSTPAFAPVPAGDNPATYSRQPVASGPYRVAGYQQGVAVTLKRNEHWSASTDQVRTALPDTIIYSLGQDSSVAAQRLIANSGEDRYAFGADLVSAAQLAQVTSNPAARVRLATSDAGPLTFLAINTERVAQVEVRRAISAAVDRNAVKAALGGDMGAAVASTCITPGIPGRRDVDLYPSDVARARQLLAGRSLPRLTLLCQNDATQTAVAQAVGQSLTEVGLRVTISPVESDTFSERATEGNGSSYDLVIGSWNPDYPSANANLEPLFASSEIGQGGYNMARYRNTQVDAMIARAQETLDATQAQQQWAAIDRRVAQDVAVVPLAFRRNSFLRGSGVTDFFVDPFPAYPNYLVLGVSGQ